jgi:glycosyltransferase involved in cell wall biosynthesis
MWAQALDVVLNDPKLRQSLGEAGVVKAERYDWDRVVDAIFDVYQQAQARASVNLVAAGVHKQAARMG